MKVLTVLGARPQFVKAATVSRELAKDNEISEVILHTGQHFDKNMSDVFFDEMQIPQPNYNLNINNLSHGAMTGQMLEKIEEIIQKENPDYILVYGDTNSTLAGAIAAKKIHIKVAHVEAGLRSFNMKMPEEINRILTDRISDVLFCPTDVALHNLSKEGFDNFECEIVKNGDVMLDAAMFYSEMSDQKSNICNELNHNEFAICTIHRPENTDVQENLSGIINAINEISTKIPIVLPLHPRTKKIMAENGIKTEFDVIEPVGYLDMISLLKNCKFVMTDSGGMQKEAYFFKKQCITMREQTEWTELIENGWNTIVGADRNKILNSASDILSDNLNKKPWEDIYGEGNASEVIVSSLKKFHIS